MKWIIVARLPLGTEMAFSVYEKDGEKVFALVPIKDGVIRKALAWDTKEDAEAHLAKQLYNAPKLKDMGEFEIRPTFEPN